MRKLTGAAAALLLSGSQAADGRPDDDMVRRYCLGMAPQVTMPDGTRADCISATHAIEVEISDLWAQSLGQALHYAYWTREIAVRPDDFPEMRIRITVPKKAGIVLVCRRIRDRNDPEDTCTGHYARLYRIIEEYRLPVTIWDCNWNADMALSDCLKVDMPSGSALAPATAE